jgi:HSP20 family protein
MRDRREISLPALPYDVDRFFGRMMRGIWPARLARPWRFPAAEWLPDIDMLEREGKIIVQADVPGIKKEDIDVSVEGDMLMIRGHREEEKEIKEKDYYRSERSMGEFARSITLPEGVDRDSLKATYKDGVLEIEMARPSAPEPKKVTVA